MLRYSLLRILIFFGVAAVFWLLGLRDSQEMFLLVALSAVVSLVISAVVLKPFRDEASTQLATRIAARRARQTAPPQTQERDRDAVAEDDEDGGDFR